MPDGARLSPFFAITLAASWAATDSGARASARRDTQAATPSAACGVATAARDTAHFVHLVGPRRVAGTLSVWTEADGALRYAERWQNGTSILTRGEDVDHIEEAGRVCVLEGRISRLRIVRSRNGVPEDSLSMIRAGDSLIVEANGRRIAALSRAVALIPPVDWVLSEALVALFVNLARQQPGRTLELNRLGQSILDTVATRVRLPVPATLYVLRFGPGTRARHVWLDRAGRLVGSCRGGTIRAGLEVAHDALCGEEIRAGEPRMLASARRIGVTNPRGTAFEHATVIDVEGDSVLRDATIVVRGMRIAALGPTGQVAVPRGATVVDATNLTIVPGLWDMLYNLSRGGRAAWSAMSDLEARNVLARGITSIRDIGADTLYSAWQAARIERGGSLGPRVFLGGILDGWYPDAPRSPAFRSRIDVPGQVTDSAQAIALIDAYRRLGYAWLQVYAILPPALTAMAVREAHRRGMRVAGHVPVGMTTDDALAAGFDEITHVAQAVRSLIPGGSTEPSAREFVYAMGDALDTEGPAARALVARFREASASLDATLCNAEAYLNWDDRNAIADPVPARDTVTFRKMVTFVRLLRTAGVRITIGSDGCDLIREMELMEQAGFTRAEILRMATLDAARGVGRDHDLGSIAVGKLADLVLIGGNPLEQLDHLRRPLMVMQGGVLFNALEQLPRLEPFLLRP